MEYIKKINNINERLNTVGEFSCNKLVYDELGEGVFFFREYEYYGFIKDGFCEGFIGGIVKKNKNYIKYLYVHKKYRKKGIGDKLVSKFMSLCIGDIYVVSSNMGQNFYEKKGFKVYKNYKSCKYMVLNQFKSSN